MTSRLILFFFFCAVRSCNTLLSLFIPLDDREVACFVVKRMSLLRLPRSVLEVRMTLLLPEAGPLEERGEVIGGDLLEDFLRIEVGLPAAAWGDLWLACILELNGSSPIIIYSLPIPVSML